MIIAKNGDQPVLTIRGVSKRYACRDRDVRAGIVDDRVLRKILGMLVAVSQWTLLSGTLVPGFT